MAAGTETVEGYKQLTHLDLCSFYPALISQLNDVSADDSAAERVLKPDALDYLAAYPKLIEISHAGHRAIQTRWAFLNQIFRKFCTFSKF